ncbi:hypothetical protein PENTCL1PPCAC_27577, partial [Pristionchus entomophagus]
RDMEKEEHQGMIEWKDKTSRFCSHNEPVHSRQKESTIVNEKGILRKEMVTVEKSLCCNHIVNPIPVFCLSEGMLLEIPILKFYESMLSMSGTTLSGYSRILNDYARGNGKTSNERISLSSLSRAWNCYLTQLEIR